MNLTHAIGMDVLEKPNTTWAKATIVMTKLLVIFREIANKCHQEGFTLIEDLMQFDV